MLTLVWPFSTINLAQSQMAIRNLVNAITLHKLCVSCCNFIGLLSTSTSCISPIFTVQWPFWTFKLAEGQVNFIRGVFVFKSRSGWGVPASLMPIFFIFIIWQNQTPPPPRNIAKIWALPSSEWWNLGPPPKKKPPPPSNIFWMVHYS